MSKSVKVEITVTIAGLKASVSHYISDENIGSWRLPKKEFIASITRQMFSELLPVAIDGSGLTDD